MKCKAAYAGLARKYNHLLEHHVNKTQPKLNTYGSNLTDLEAEALRFEELDEQVQHDIADATVSNLAAQLGVSTTEEFRTHITGMKECS